ncbi:MAG: phosphoribosylanthranilate isomerase [Niabella sp.]
MPLIKVCGMTELAQVQSLAVMGVDFVGFIFYPKSPRYVADKLDGKKVKAVHDIQKVGVFVNEAFDNLAKTVEEYGLTHVQLHGDEGESYCRAAGKLAKVIKVFRITGEENLRELVSPYVSVADYFLFDTKVKEYGGSGKKFDWGALLSMPFENPFFLSGGIGADDVGDVKAFILHHPSAHQLILDLNSKFETAPGVKDLNLLQKTIADLKR